MSSYGTEDACDFGPPFNFIYAWRGTKLTVDQQNHRRSSLPETIRFDDVGVEEALDELTYFARGRELCIRALLYRPFLFLAIHAPPRDDSQQKEVRKYAQKALNICVKNNSGYSITHRHHGTWYGLRESIAAGFMMFAAKMSGLSANNEAFFDGVLDDRVYEHTIQACLQRLRYWEAESPADVRRGRELLEDLYAHG